LRALDIYNLSTEVVGRFIRAIIRQLLAFSFEKASKSKAYFDWFDYLTKE